MIIQLWWSLSLTLPLSILNLFLFFYFTAFTPLSPLLSLYCHFICPTYTHVYQTVMVSLEGLSKIVDPSQLTADFEGSLEYNHDDWIEVWILSLFVISFFYFPLLFGSPTERHFRLFCVN